MMEVYDEYTEKELVSIRLLHLKMKM